MTTIYLDERTKKLIDQYKRENPHFNLSGFLQKMVKQFMEEEEPDIAKIEYDIKEAELEINRLEQKILYLKEKKRDTIQKNKRQEQDKEKLIQELSESIIKYTNLPEKEAKALASMYYEIRHKTSITKFLDDQNISIL